MPPRPELQTVVAGGALRLRSVQAVGAGAEEVEEAHVPQDLELLADFAGYLVEGADGC